MIHTKTKSNQL